MFFSRKAPPMNPYEYEQQHYAYHQPPHPAHPMYWQHPPHYEQQVQTPYPPYSQPSTNLGGVPPTPQPTQQYGRPKSSINITNAFKNEEGKFDLEKTTNTIDQVLRVGGQISPIVKQVGSLFITKL